MSARRESGARPSVTYVKPSASRCAHHRINQQFRRAVGRGIAAHNLLDQPAVAVRNRRRNQKTDYFALLFTCGRYPVCFQSSPPVLPPAVLRGDKHAAIRQPVQRDRFGEKMQGREQAGQSSTLPDRPEVPGGYARSVGHSSTYTPLLRARFNCARRELCFLMIAGQLPGSRLAARRWEARHGAEANSRRAACSRSAAPK